MCNERSKEVLKFQVNSLVLQNSVLYLQDHYFPIFESYILVAPLRIILLQCIHHINNFFLKVPPKYSYSYLIQGFITLAKLLIPITESRCARQEPVEGNTSYRRLQKPIKMQDLGNYLDCQTKDLFALLISLNKYGIMFQEKL